MDDFILGGLPAASGGTLIIVSQINTVDHAVFAAPGIFERRAFGTGAAVGSLILRGGLLVDLFAVVGTVGRVQEI